MRVGGLALVVLGGCRQLLGFEDVVANEPADGDLVDSVNDANVNDAPSSCVLKWLDQTVTLSSPEVVPNINFGTAERDPWLDQDESFIYFSRPGTGGDLDVMFSERAPSGFFNTPQQNTSLSDATGDDSKVAMTADELTAVVASDRGGQGFDLFEAKRSAAGTTAFAAVTNANLVAVNSAGTELDPHLSSDGLRLYYVAQSPQKIFVAERATLDATFASGIEISNIGDTAGDADPTLSGDELVIVFTSNRIGLGGADLWYATRPQRDQPFGAPVQVPTVNSTSNENDAHLSPDGCHLYSTSDRAGSFDIYLSVVQ